MTLDQGWSQGPEERGALVLAKGAGTLQLFVVFGILPDEIPAGSFSPDPVPADPLVLARRLAARPGVTATEPESARVAGRSGASVELRWSGRIDDPQCGGCAPLLALRRASGLFGVGPGETDRVTMVRVGDETVLVDLVAPESQLEQFAREVAPVLETLRFEPD